MTVIYYWKDALEKAGIQDNQVAFSTGEALIDTLKKLRKSGYAYPLAMTTISTPARLHEAAHWIWSAGGDFISPDYHQAIFNQPAAMQGWKNYFGLQPFISPESVGASSGVDLFDKGEAAVHFGGPFLGSVGHAANPEWGKRLGIAQAPKTAFVGGSSFVIWQYSLHDQEAFELVRFLSSQPTRIPATSDDQGLPTRREAINMPSVESNIFHRTYLQSLQTGRSFPTIRLWGSVEDKLIVEISNIWAELFADPGLDLDACLHRHFDPLTERLNVVLES